MYPLASTSFVSIIALHGKSKCSDWHTDLDLQKKKRQWAGKMQLC